MNCEPEQQEFAFMRTVPMRVPMMGVDVGGCECVVLPAAVFQYGGVLHVEGCTGTLTVVNINHSLWRQP